MSNIFKTIPDKNIILNYIKENSYNINNRYIIDINIYKKSLLNCEIDKLIIYIKPFYFKVKHIYLERKINYKNYLTIIRQLLNIFNIKYIKKIKYFHSIYEIIYIIYEEDEIFNKVPNKLSTFIDCSLDSLENQL
jgi:hypothetical protein